MSEADIRKMGKDGTLFATYDKIKGGEFLPENLLIHTSSDIAKMAEQVINLCMKEIN